MTSPDDLAGRTLAGRWQILRPLGEEALGRVWAARDAQADRLVQVKVLPPALAADPERFARFAREMKASFLVAHPNTVEVLDYGDEDGAYYLVLEYLAAHTLREELARGRLEPERAAVVAAQVAHALGAAHQEGIVHRALSLDNVLLLDNTDDDYVKVRDFGFSKLEGGGEDEPELTASDIRLGDAECMAPEYVETGEFTPKGDLYALGALLFHLVAGRPPFEGDREQLLVAAVSTPAPRLRTLVPATPPWLDALVADLLSKRPQDRPSVYKIVQRIEDGLGGPVKNPEVWPLAPDGTFVRRTPPAAEGPGLPMLLVGGLAVLLVGGVGAAVVLTGLVAVAAFVLALPR